VGGIGLVKVPLVFAIFTLLEEAFRQVEIATVMTTKSFTTATLGTFLNGYHGGSLALYAKELEPQHL